MKPVSVKYQNRRLDLDISPDALIGSWAGPAGMPSSELPDAFRHALENPIEFPPAGQLVVPGDRVAIALDGSLPDAEVLLRVLFEILDASDIEASDIAVVATPNVKPSLAAWLPAGIPLITHNPDDRERLAYLAATKAERPVYLNRYLTDADVVIPVGRLGFDPLHGYRGPWSMVFPGLSDQSTQIAHRLFQTQNAAGAVSWRERLAETLEVSWLLGTFFQVGLIPGETGIARMVAGLAEPMSDAAIREVDRLWTFNAPAKADTVVVGVGDSDEPATIETLVDGLVTASRLVNHGGKIIALSQTEGPPGPSIQRLAGASEAHAKIGSLKGHDTDADSVEGALLAQVLAWANVYLHSGLNRDLVEDLSIVPLDHPDEAKRLASRSDSVIVVSRAELTRAIVSEEPAV